MKPAGPPQPRGFLGIELADGREALTVAKVLARGPAEKAGLQSGDQIKEINGKAVITAADVQRLTAQVVTGQTVRLTIRRGEETKEISIRAGDGL